MACPFCAELGDPMLCATHMDALTVHQDNEIRWLRTRVAVLEAVAAAARRYVDFKSDNVEEIIAALAAIDAVAET